MAPETGSAILVIEDEAYIRDLVVGELADEGYTCVAVTGVAEATARLRERPYRLILLDLILRDGSGLDLLRTIRDTPILVVSGSSIPMLQEAATADAVRAVLTKPFGRRELREKVAQCLQASGGDVDDVSARSETPAPAGATPDSIGTVAHALKNLLAVALGEVEFLLSDESRLDPRLQHDGLESIRRVVLDSRLLIWRLEGLAAISRPSPR